MGAYGSPELSPRPPVYDSDIPKTSYKLQWGIPWLSVLRVFLWSIIIALMLYLSYLLVCAYSAIL